MDEEKRKLIINMGKSYIKIKNSTYEKIGEMYGVSRTTVGKYFTKFLKDIDSDLYKKVREKTKENLERTYKNLKNHKEEKTGISALFSSIKSKLKK